MPNYACRFLKRRGLKKGSQENRMCLQTRRGLRAGVCPFGLETPLLVYCV